MSRLRTNAWHRAVALLERQKGIVVLAVVIALTSSGTAAAVSYVVLGGTSQTSVTTNLRSNVNGAVLQVTNFDTTGATGARGININVPAGRSPITVNSTGKATNLNADMVDGLNANAFLGVNQTAANSNLLDGADSTDFMAGPGKVVRWAADLPALNGYFIEFPLAADFFLITYMCPDPVEVDGFYRLRNLTSDPFDVFIDSGATNPVYTQVGPGDTIDGNAVATGEWIDIQIQSWSKGIAEISMFTVHRVTTSDCHAQLMAVISGP